MNDTGGSFNNRSGLPTPLKTRSKDKEETTKPEMINVQEMIPEIVDQLNVAKMLMDTQTINKFGGLRGRQK